MASTVARARDDPPTRASGRSRSAASRARAGAFRRVARATGRARRSRARARRETSSGAASARRASESDDATSGIFAE